LEECYSQTLKKIENIKVIDILVYIFSRKVWEIEVIWETKKKVNSTNKN
jgi:hypothetical protein